MPGDACRDESASSARRCAARGPRSRRAAAERSTACLLLQVVCVTWAFLRVSGAPGRSRRKLRGLSGRVSRGIVVGDGASELDCKLRSRMLPAWGQGMNRYEAGKEPVEEWGGETRDWVFPLLGNPRYRERLEELAKVELTRRPGCESCLRSLVVDQWTPETIHHLGWCDSCRRASIALGKIPAGGTGGHGGRHAVLLVLLAGAAIAAPLVGSQLIGGGGDNPGGGAGARAATPPAPA